MVDRVVTPNKSMKARQKPGPFKYEVGQKVYYYGVDGILNHKEILRRDVGKHSNLNQYYFADRHVSVYEDEIFL